MIYYTVRQNMNFFFLKCD